MNAIDNNTHLIICYILLLFSLTFIGTAFCYEIDKDEDENEPPAMDLHEILQVETLDIPKLSGEWLIDGVLDESFWEHPFPVRYVITSKFISGGPQYSIQTRNWKTGGEVAVTDFQFKNPTKADKVELEDLKSTDELPDHFVIGDKK